MQPPCRLAAAHMVSMTHINPVAESARESARGATGRFGEQHHTAPETTLPEISARATRIEEMSARLLQLHVATAALEASLKTELIGEVWARTPIEAETLVFDSYDSGFGPNVEFGAALDANGDEITLANDMPFRDAAANLDPDDLEYNPGYSGHVIEVGKDSTRDRIRDLEEEYRTGESGRSGRQIGDDIDVATSRYLRQVAAEQGWQSAELDWDEEGREGLKLSAVVANGVRRPAGSGHLDDHEAIWAASRFIHPAPSVMSTDRGPGGPFTITFTN